jgi:DNA-binding MarR family transcriptional regulator
MRKISRAVTQYYDNHLEPIGLRITQFTLLLEISTASVKSLSEIAENLIMDRTTLTRNLKPLQMAGYLTSTSTTDKRSKAYVLTEKGQHALKEGIPLWQEAQDKIVNSFGSHEYKVLLSDLSKLLKITNNYKNAKL